MTRALVALAMLLGACAKPTEILVVMSTDVPGSAYDSVSIDIGNHDNGKTSFSRTYLVPDEASLPASLDLHPSNGSPTVQLDLALESAGAPLVTRTAIVSFVNDRSLLLRLELQAACEHVVCDEGMTCIDGTCQSNVVEPATLTPIPPNPLDPVDAAIASTPDAATSDAAVVDAAVADAAVAPDLALPSPDMAGPCAPIPEPPNSGGCQTFTPDGPLFINSNFNASGVTPTTLSCNGKTRYAVHLTTLAGNMSSYTLRWTNSTTTTPLIIRAGYSMTSTTDNAFAGVSISDMSSLVELYTQTVTGSPDDLYYYEQRGGGVSVKLDSSTFTGVHVLELDRINSSGTDTTAEMAFTGYSSGTSGSANTKYDLPAVTMTPNNTVGFYAVNATSQGDLYVQLAWLQICSAN